MTCLGSLHWLPSKQKYPKEQITPPHPVRKSSGIKLFVKQSHCVSNFSCVCSLWKATGSSRQFQNPAGQNLILLKLSFYMNCSFSLHRLPLLISAKLTARVSCSVKYFFTSICFRNCLKSLCFRENKLNHKFYTRLTCLYFQPCYLMEEKLCLSLAEKSCYFFFKFKIKRLINLINAF